MTKPTTNTPSHDNITPEMKAANHAICTLADAMRDCEHCPFNPATTEVKPTNDKAQSVPSEEAGED